MILPISVQLGNICGHLQTFLIVVTGREANSLQWVEARDVVKYFKIPKIALYKREISDPKCQ